MKNEDMLRQQAHSQPIDKIISKSIVDFLQKQVGQLESKKADVMNIQIKYGMTTLYSNGVIKGLDVAIGLLNNDIEYLNKE